MDSRTTRLSAVNRLLSAASSRPVNSLEGNLPELAQRAIRCLDDVSLDVQSNESYNFNKLRRIQLSPQVGTGEILVPSDYIYVYPPKQVDIGQIGMFLPQDDVYEVIDGKLFNITKNTYAWTRAVTVDAVRYLEWDALPPYARRKILADAAVRFHSETVNDTQTLRYLLAEQRKATIGFMNADARVRDNKLGRNPFNNPMFPKAP